MIVGMCVDWMGNEQEEYEEIKEEIKKILEQEKIIFKEGIMPHMINTPLDLYIVDFGGVLSGCDDTIISFFGGLLDSIENRPQTLFIIWTSFTLDWYIKALHKEAKEYVEGELPFNVIIFDKDNNECKEKIKDWKRRN